MVEWCKLLYSFSQIAAVVGICASSSHRFVKFREKLTWLRFVTPPLTEQCLVSGKSAYMRCESY